MVGYIYITTNHVNNKRYIGRRTSSVFLAENYLGSGIHLLNAVKKYGKENFTVELIEECETYDELVERETYYIKKYDAVNSTEFYNQSYGGYDEGFINGGQNIACTARARKLNSEAHKGKNMSPEFCEHQRQIHIGKPSGMAGKKHSKETKAQIGNTVRQNNLSRDHSIYDKVSETAKGNKMMNKDGICIRVHPEEFDKYLSEGWVFGGLKRNVNRSKENNPMFGKSAVKGRKWIHKGEERLYVYESELEPYLADGWLFGMK